MTARCSEQYIIPTAHRMCQKFTMSNPQRSFLHQCPLSCTSRKRPRSLRSVSSYERRRKAQLLEDSLTEAEVFTVDMPTASATGGRKGEASHSPPSSVLHGEGKPLRTEEFSSEGEEGSSSLTPALSYESTREELSSKTDDSSDLPQIPSLGSPGPSASGQGEISTSSETASYRKLSSML